MMIKELFLYNTLSRSKERFEPLNAPSVKMYTCGPTVYDFAHIGNFRTYVFEDILRKTLLLSGFTVEHVMNITDVDDKTIRGALQSNQSLDKYVEPYIEAFFEDLQTLGCQMPEHTPKATEYIPRMIEMIEELFDQNVAYQGGDGSIYFSIQKFDGYGKLSHLKLEELEAGASNRVQTDEYDRDTASDFVLWKWYDDRRDGLVFWESPWGRGRPGWHLECSAMATSLLGPSLDLHCGAVDNIFPHHENEIAQSECCTGKPFAKFWLHAEHLIVDGKKMSKSLGNFYTLRTLLSLGFSGREVRYLLLSQHYRTQLNFTLQGLEGAKHALQRIDDFIRRLQEANGGGATIEALVEKLKEGFFTPLADDLNLPKSLGAFFEVLREVNGLIDEGLIGEVEKERLLALLKEINQVLSVMRFDQEEDVPLALLDALEKRTKARSEKRWKDADHLRSFIESHGYLVEDTPSGPKLKKI